MSFDTLGLSEPLLRAIARQGYENPTPIQAKAIPPILQGRDVVAAAQTGTGKTAGFTLPMLQRLSEAKEHGRRVRALVLTPTRELAAQVQESVRDYGCHLPLRSAVVFGGVNINPQIDTLRKGVDILVATPGRLLDLHGQGAVNLRHVEILVLDEADRMLDMGFIHDVRRVLKLLPEQKQSLLFSATFSTEIRALIADLLHDPVTVEVSPRNTTAEIVEQWVHPVDKSRKAELLADLIHRNGWEQVLVFTRTKHGANRLAEYLEKNGVDASAIHGNKSQAARTRALANFKHGEIRALVATDIAARGLDIEQLPLVVNYELPNVAEDYVHRIGRTGRAGCPGQAVSLLSADERGYLRDIERLIKQTLRQEIVAGFEPDPNAPVEAAPHVLQQQRARERSQQRRRPRPQGNAGNGGAARGNSSAAGNSNAASRDDSKPSSAKPRRRRKPAAGNRGVERGNQPPKRMGSPSGNRSGNR
ncbi:MAG: DEAD/DEAH box helicase [Gammaproteobacteria bacterium]|nr:MAG: DEAD/DEAH box helicase [Gammaproteobacteria bacterium]